MDKAVDRRLAPAGGCSLTSKAEARAIANISTTNRQGQDPSRSAAVFSSLSQSPPTLSSLESAHFHVLHPRLIPHSM